MEAVSNNLLISVSLLFSQLGLAFFLLKGKYSDVIILSIFHISSLYLFIQMINNIPPSDIIVWSENVVNFIVISLAVSVYLTRYIKKKKLLIHPAIITLIIAFWAQGRSGVIVSLILLFVVIIYKFNFKQKYIGLTLIGFISLFFTESFFQQLKVFGINIATRGGTRDGMTNNVRFDIWREYFNDLDFKTIFLGFNTNHQHLFYGFTDLHNGFLDGHFKFGIFMLLIYLILIFACIKLMKSREYFIVILLTIFLLRGFTDSVVFTGRFDYIYFSVLIYSFIILELRKENMVYN